MTSLYLHDSGIVADAKKLVVITGSKRKINQGLTIGRLTAFKEFSYYFIHRKIIKPGVNYFNLVATAMKGKIVDMTLLYNKTIDWRGVMGILLVQLLLKKKF